MQDTPSNLSSGFISENQACHYLQAKGLRLISKNYRCPYGEIDLIMQEKNTLVFVEVRLRTHTAFGNAFESIDSRKQQKLLKSATHYLQKNQLLDKVDCRFDVVGFSNNTIEWMKDAFSYE
jgi:putative endonuclease